MSGYKEEIEGRDERTGIGGSSELIPFDPVPVTVGSARFDLYLERIELRDCVPPAPGRMHVAISLVGTLPNDEARAVYEMIRKAVTPPEASGR